MDNEKYEKLFPDCKKAEAFDQISEMFYNRNFSSASKAEIELQMFSIYMDATIDLCRNEEDNTIDYNACSDYEMGKALGISQERIRTLKVKKQARYPKEFDWKQSLLSIKDNIRYEKEKKKIIIPTRDPNLYNEIRNFIESKGGYIEIHHSSNFIQIRPEYYFMLMYENLDENNKKRCREELIKQLQKNEKNNEIREASTPIEVLRQVTNVAKAGTDIMDFICSISSLLLPGSPLALILETVIKQCSLFN